MDIVYKPGSSHTVTAHPLNRVSDLPKIWDFPPGEYSMSPDPQPLNPSQTVERIREIIVGRHLERLEQRVAMLETSVPPPPATSAPTASRHPANPGPLEALQHNVQRLLESNREQTDLRLSQYRQETQRLAVQIQQVVAMKASEPPPRAINQLERKIGNWLTDWQNSIQVHLHDRDKRITAQVHHEVAALWARTESQLTRLESQTIDRQSIDEHFNRIATAIRGLADSVSPSPFHPGSAAR